MLERVAILPMELQRNLRMVMKEKRTEVVGQLTTVLDDGDSVMGISDDVRLDVGQIDCDEDIMDDDEIFLKPVSQSVNQCMLEFIDGTSNEAIHAHICMVCV